jgi:hypothetical protein
LLLQLLLLQLLLLLLGQGLLLQLRLGPGVRHAAAVHLLPRVRLLRAALVRDLLRDLLLQGRGWWGTLLHVALLLGRHWRPLLLALLLPLLLALLLQLLGQGLQRGLPRRARGLQRLDRCTRRSR